MLLTARREELVQQAAADAGPGAIAMRADVTSEEDVAAMVSRALDEFGHVDIMCNNAAAPGTICGSGSRRWRTGMPPSPWM